MQHVNSFSVLCVELWTSCMLSSCFTVESYLQPYGIWVFDTTLGLVMLFPVIVVICHLHHESQS